jgi:hypothetical protein
MLLLTTCMYVLSAFQWRMEVEVTAQCRPTDFYDLSYELELCIAALILNSLSFRFCFFYSPVLLFSV